MTAVRLYLISFQCVYAIPPGLFTRAHAASSNEVDVLVRVRVRMCVGGSCRLSTVDCLMDSVDVVHQPGGVVGLDD